MVFKVLASKIQEIGAIADKNKGEDSYQMLMAIQSASDALNWVTVVSTDYFLLSALEMREVILYCKAP